MSNDDSAARGICPDSLVNTRQGLTGHLVPVTIGGMTSKQDRRTYNATLLLSLALLVGSGTLLLIGMVFDPRECSLSITPDFHICVDRMRRGDVRIVFFNDKEYGPYRGSIIGMTDERGNIYPPIARRSAWGDCCGIYWRYFHWKKAWGRVDPVLWTLMVSLWYPVILFSILPAIWLWRRHRRKTIPPALM